MANYFNYFPKTYYSSDNKTTGLDSVTNIIARFGFEKTLKENSSTFYKYNIQESDTPEIIAHKYYGSAERHWIVLMFNDIVDPMFDWPMQYETLINYIDAKYSANNYADTANTSVSGLSWAMNTSHIQAYYKIITKTDNDNISLVEKISVNANTYANVPVSTQIFTLANGDKITQTISKEIKSYYDYEIDENESKREITLIKKDFVKEIEKEFKRVIKQ